MSFNPKPCAHCGCATFHVLPGMQHEVWRASSVLGVKASEKLPGARWTFTAVVCTQCGRTELFTIDAGELAARIPGSQVVSSVGR